MVLNDLGVLETGCQKRYAVRVIGALRVTDAAGDAVQFRSAKARALFAYVLLAPEMRQSREHLAAVFWPDSDEQHARASLRQAIVAIRRAFADDAGEILRNDADTLSLAPDTFEIDADRLTANDLLSLSDFEFLSDIRSSGEGFDEWRRVEARKLSERIWDLGGEAMQAAADAGDHEKVRVLAGILATIEPLNEQPHRLRFDAEVALGRLSAALKTFDDFKRIIRRDLDIEPTQDFAAAADAARRASNLRGGASHTVRRSLMLALGGEWERPRAARYASYAVGVLMLALLGVIAMSAGSVQTADTARSTASASPAGSARRVWIRAEHTWIAEALAAHPALKEHIDKCTFDGENTEVVVNSCSLIIETLGNEHRFRAIALANRATAHRWNGDFARSIKDFEASFAIEPKNYNALQGMGYTYFVMQDYEHALELYARVRELQPVHFMAVFRTGEANFELGRYEDAIAALTTATLENPEYWAAYFLRGRAYAALGQYSLAERDIKKAVSINGGIRREAEREFEAIRQKQRAARTH